MQDRRPQSLDRSFTQRLMARLNSDIDPRWADLILGGCFFCTGLIDSVAFSVFSCFVAMQTGMADCRRAVVTGADMSTGNTVFVSLGISGLPKDSPRYSCIRSLIAIVCFCLGAIFFSTYHRHYGPLKRWVLLSSFLLQTILILITAILATTGVVAKDRVGASTFPWSDLCPIALLAFQSAGQVVASRVLKYNSMPTVVLTSLYCDLMSDPHLFTAGLFDDADRNRRAGGAIVLFAGASIGAALSKTSVGFGGIMWIASGLKAIMVLAWLLWKQKISRDSTGV